MKRILIFSVFSLFIFPVLAFGAQPSDVIKEQVDLIINILKDPQFQQPEQRGKQRERMWAVIRQVFDFTEMSKRTVGTYWKKFTGKEKEEFSDVFSKLLGNAYLDKIQRGFRDEKIVFLSEKMFSKSKARVKTKVLRDNIEIPVFYSMLKSKEAWRIYDVTIEGISLVKNYRAQFSKILIKNKPSKLIEMLVKKVERQKKDRALKQKIANRPEDMIFLNLLCRTLAYKRDETPMFQSRTALLRLEAFMKKQEAH